MLQWLTIKNLALVEDAEIDFKKGFNVISGETGAGKTVIINAVSLLLGQRVDKSLIRKGRARCELSACIYFPEKLKNKLKTFFETNGIEFNGNEVILRKVITHSSSRNYINDSSVTLNILSRLGSELFDFHGPNQHQSLLKPSLQLELLDKYSNCTKLKNECADAFKIMQEAELELKELKNKLPDAVEAGHLRKIIREIENAENFLYDEKNLIEQFNIVSNSKEILQILYEVKNDLQESEDSLISRLANTNRALYNLSKYDTKQSEDFIERVNGLTEEVNELSIDIDDYSSSIEIDEQEYLLLEEKTSSINTLKRLYGPSVEDIMTTLENARQRIETLDNFQYLKQDLEEKTEILREKYNKIAEKLSCERKKNARAFSEATGVTLKKLGFMKSEISVLFKESPPSRAGIDKIEIMFCPNPGEQNQPLKNIASSGEISRVMLAIKTVLSDADDVPILIFDEIDTNIGGKTAHRVGSELKKLGQKHHVLCISHLPQVASLADCHFRVAKEIIDSRTYSKIIKLDTKERVKEISRMLGNGDAAEKHARELLNSQQV
ncbi:MAG: DNA repair protein RecN [Victivallales bacterium]|nr:DNA repair protein RecN [Victivallales bacterium]